MTKHCNPEPLRGQGPCVQLCVCTFVLGEALPMCLYKDTIKDLMYILFILSL